MVADVVMPRRVLADYPGPKFGVEGLRRLVGVPRGPMIMTALKPMGSSTAELARMAYEFAKGGIDIIKDDHGLADQPYSPYDERVRACAAAVARANAETTGGVASTRLASARPRISSSPGRTPRATLARGRC